MTKSTAAHATESILPLAYSYIRFSTKEQSKGDSLRRQTDAVRKWCDANNVRLDESTTLHDLGRSAFSGKHRQNPDTNALAAFLKMTEDGKIPQGSYLVVENLDRLTREHLRAAVGLFFDIQGHGINIVTTTPEKVFRHDSKDMIDIMLAVVELSRGHAESARKSELIGGAWASKREAARQGSTQPIARRENRVGGMRILTHSLPLWLEEKGGKPVIIAERAKVVRKIFKLAADGYSLRKIIRRLEADKVKPFGAFEVYEEEREDGKKVEKVRAKKGERFGSGRWTAPYLSRIIRDRRALGEYQPVSRGKPDGDPIPNFYPAAVTEQEFYAARSSQQPVSQFQVRSRIGKHIDLFTRLIKDARDGTSYLATTSSGTRKLINATATDGRSRTRSFPLAAFEKGVLEGLAEIDPKDVTGEEDDPADEVKTLAAEHAGIESELLEASAHMEAKGFSATIAKHINKLETRQREVALQLANARTRKASPISEAWGEAKSLLSVLKSASDQTDARIRLRSSIRKIITDILLLVVPRGDSGRERIATVQLNFKSGGWRVYRILYRSGSNGRESGWCTIGDSTREREMFADADLRNQSVTMDEENPETHWAGVTEEIEFLENCPNDILQRIYHKRHQPA